MLAILALVATVAAVAGVVWLAATNVDRERERDDGELLAWIQSLGDDEEGPGHDLDARDR